MQQVATGYDRQTDMTICHTDRFGCRSGLQVEISPIYLINKRNTCALVVFQALKYKCGPVCKKLTGMTVSCKPLLYRIF